MSNSSSNRSTESFFGEVISTYTRAQAIEDGVLIDTGRMAQEAGFKWPVAVTSAAWADCIAWTEDDSEQQVYQDQSGRLWDVLFMASHAIRHGLRFRRPVAVQALPGASRRAFEGGRTSDAETDRRPG